MFHQQPKKCRFHPPLIYHSRKAWCYNVGFWFTIKTEYICWGSPRSFCHAAKTARRIEKKAVQPLYRAIPPNPKLLPCHHKLWRPWYIESLPAFSFKNISLELACVGCFLDGDGNARIYATYSHFCYLHVAYPANFRTCERFSRLFYASAPSYT